MPVNWLSQRLRTLRLERLPSCAGIAPAILFSLRTNHSNLERLPSCWGIAPVNWFLRE